MTSDERVEAITNENEAILERLRRSASSQQMSFAYQVDMSLLLRLYDAANARAERAEAQLREIQATLDAAGVAESVPLTVNGKTYEVEFYFQHEPAADEDTSTPAPKG